MQHNVTNEEELTNVTLGPSDLSDKGKTFKEEDHTGFNATEEEATNVTLPSVDLTAEDGDSFLNEKR